MNETIIILYNNIIKAAESFDWLTIILSSIAIAIAYYALLYNRPRIEITTNKSSYNFKESLNSIKLEIYNVGTTTAFNVEMKHKYDIKKLFYYHDNIKDYDKVRLILEQLDKIGQTALERRSDHYHHIQYTKDEIIKIEKLNTDIKELFPKAKRVEPLTFSENGIDSTIREIDNYMEKIENRSLYINNSLDCDIPTLLPNDKKISHFVDFSYEKTRYGEFNFEDITVHLLYDDIKKMDMIGVLLFSTAGVIIYISKKILGIMNLFVSFLFVNKFTKKTYKKLKLLNICKKTLSNTINIKEKINKLKENNIYQRIDFFLLIMKRFLLIEFNLEKMEIIIKRQEVKKITFKNPLIEEDFDIQKKIYKAKHTEYVYKEFNEFLNSYIFQNWLTTLNNIEKQKISELLINPNLSMNIFINGYELYKNKKYNKEAMKKKNENFLNKYMNLIHIINGLPEESPLISVKMKEKIENIIFKEKYKL